MRLRRILQRVGVVDRHVELAVDDGGEQRVGAFEQFLAGRGVVVEFRSSPISASRHIRWRRIGLAVVRKEHRAHVIG